MPIENCVQAFEPYIALNSHVKKPVIHISLNPSPKDILSEEQMAVLAQEFMEKFGYGNQPYMVWLHEDINRKHMHIVSVRINEKGEKIDHNREAVRAQNICREMEVKYGLHPTLGEHGFFKRVSTRTGFSRSKFQLSYGTCLLYTSRCV